MKTKEEYTIPEVPFIFPYSDDKMTRRQQMKTNLQTGILFEDNGFFLPWSTPYGALDKIAEQKREGGGHTYWYLGHHTILGGYKSHITVHGLGFKMSDPIRQIEEMLGVEKAGEDRANEARDIFNESLGELINPDYGKVGNLSLGNMRWKLGDCDVMIIGIERFDYFYYLYVGLGD
ncbi:MAG: hypothetical protein IT258_02865 [Saprospiraceae bacterium]|nr:hypothetical protein [Saprospiraceae bacterium]